jgi:N4-(beta-N-acetylglucosaminyl)-L-asparaginase
MAGTVTSKPVVVASANGIRGVEKAYQMMTREGTDPLDAVIAGVNIEELDPEDIGVGLGGLPNEDGIVQLDASCMHGPTRRAGGVAALEGIATPSLVAKAVMDYTDHVLLAGDGAKKFALRMGFKEQDLLTDKSRQMWLRWRARLNPSGNWLDPDADARLAFTAGTINMNAVNAKGDIGSVTSTSGLAWKIPGRVGDSPILGAGQYCDNDVGAAGAVGRGEANIKACGAFLAVELMGQGLAPLEALERVMQRVLKMTEQRLFDANGRPAFDLNLFAVNKAGQTAGYCLYEGAKYAVCDGNGPRVLECTHLYKKSERPTSAMVTSHR